MSIQLDRSRSEGGGGSGGSSGGAPGKATLTGKIQRRARDGNGVAAGAEAQVAGLGSGGVPLPDSVRGQFEGSLGADLGAVRVHTGADSAAAADAVGAHAFTMGNDIHFNEGAYQPGDPFGMHLLAHEVAHTVQQAGGPGAPQYKLEVSSPGDPLEHEADRAADAMVAGEPAWVSLIGGSSVDRKIQRDAKKPAPSGPHTLNEAEKKEIYNLYLDADSGYTLYKRAVKSMGAYKDSAPASLTSLQSIFESTVAATQAAYDHVGDMIKKSAEIEKVKAEIRSAVLGAIMTGVGGGMAALHEGNAAVAAEQELTDMPLVKSALTDSKSYWELAKEGKDELKEMGAEAAGKIGEVAGKINEGDAGGAAGTTPAWAQAGFYKQLSSLHAISTNQIIPIYDALANLGATIGDLVGSARSASETGKTSSKWPLEKLRTVIPHIKKAANKLDSAALKVPGIAKALQDMVKRSAAVVPKDKLTIEKEYWVRWVAQLDDSDKDTLEQSTLKKYLEGIGLWSQLGIKGGPDSAKEDNLAVWSARAQAKVLDHKGEGVAVGENLVEGSGIFEGYGAKVSLAGLPTMAAEWTDKRGQKGVVSGVRTTAMPKDEGIGDDYAKLKSADDKVAYIIKHGYVVVQLTALEADKPDPNAKKPIDDEDSIVVGG